MTCESVTRYTVRRSGAQWGAYLETRTPGVAPLRTRLASFDSAEGARAYVARAEAERMLAHADALEAEGRA